MNFVNGEVLLVHKPLLWTSFQVVNKLKYVIKSREARIKNKENENGTSVKSNDSIPKLRIGHAGTLDPLATGLLIVCTGKETKNIENYQAQEKEYTGTFFIGATTPCFDLEKPIDSTYPTEHITDTLIYEATHQFIGKIQQAPPLFSAIKIDGKRAYDIARAGQTAEMKLREVEIKTFEITRIALPQVDFRVVCSKGTYIRSLARDLGIALNSGAHLIALSRTRIGNYLLTDATSIPQFEEMMKAM